MSNFQMNKKSNKKNDKKLGLPGIVSQWYYKHGLFLSSYPTCASSIAIIVIILSCYPLLNIPLPGTIPTKVILPYDEIKNNRYTSDYHQQYHHTNNNDHHTEINENIDNSEKITVHKDIIEDKGGGGNGNDGDNLKNFSYVKNLFNNMTFDMTTPFPWTQSNPFVYVQQIIIRSSVIPWTNDLYLMDAFRAPLNEVFKLLEVIRNHESPESKVNLDQICLHVENVKRPKNEQIFPEYNCLILSPANLWGQDVHNFSKDSNILNTVYQYHNIQKTKVSVTEMLFGIPIQDTGIKRYPLRSRSRIIQYAITLILIKNDQEYLDSLREKLTSLYPLHQQLQSKNQNNKIISDSFSSTSTSPSSGSSIMYIYYPSEFNLLEFLPIFTAFILLFIYIYFSVRKMDAIKSRFLLAIFAVITVLGSLMMTLGLCFFFGLTISLESKWFFPYLVILLGLENCIVITKSVVSTDEQFDVKIRVAQGLSKEGWHISKTLLTEITILTIGLGTFIAVIQEFCVFAIVALISDFFLQMLLFSTVLAMDIKRIEYTVEAKNLPKIMCYYVNHTNNDLIKRNYYKNHYNSSGGFHRSLSHPKLPFLTDVHPKTQTTGTGNSNGGGGGGGVGNEKKIPKRLRLVNFWARTRLFQRTFMIWMCFWIFSIVYNSGFFENFFVIDLHNTSNAGDIPLSDDFSTSSTSQFTIKHTSSSSAELTLESDSNAAVVTSEITNFENISINDNENILNDKQIPSPLPSIPSDENSDNHLTTEQQNLDSIVQAEENLDKLKHPNYDINYFLSNFHWSSILKQYNISLSGKYVTILPSIKISLAIKPELAILLRNPNDKNFIQQNLQWKALAAALDPLDFNDESTNPNRHRQLSATAVGDDVSGGTGSGSTAAPLYPKSPMEICLAIILCSISVFVMTYMMVVFYRCICTRNYAEWRSSWSDSEGSLSSAQNATDAEILEGIPIQVKGHKHKIECLVSDGCSVISSCLKGQIKVWDAKSGELVTKIDRPTNNLDNKILCNDSYYVTAAAPVATASNISSKKDNISPIWCLDYLDNLIAVGCADGHLEFWETPTGYLKCTSQTDLIKPAQGITHVHLIGDRVIVARLCGKLEFYKLETYYRGKQIDWGFTSAYRRTHVRTGSTGSLQSATGTRTGLGIGANDRSKTAKEEMICTLEEVRNAHQQPIVCMEVVQDIVFTGSQDHTLKVFKLDDSSFEYSLRGHCGPITCLFVDHWQTGTGGSGSQDGLLCVWDLLTAACMYNIQAHDGAITSLVCAPSYVISLGTDERVCVWERFQGNLLNTINVTNSYSCLLMLTPSLLVTSKMGSLMVWDVRTGEPAREVKLDCANSQLCPKLMILADSSVICDYGNQLRIVRFPMVADKCN